MRNVQRRTVTQTFILQELQELFPFVVKRIEIVSAQLNQGATIA